MLNIEVDQASDAGINRNQVMNVTEYIHNVYGFKYVHQVPEVHVV